MVCGSFGVLGTTVGVQGAGGISWKTGGRAMPMARQIGSIVGPGAVRSRARRPSCSRSDVVVLNCCVTETKDAPRASMGRLTLNVLLSFAQFEREVVGERIRDKIAASKKKGMWMGGVPPLGYRLCDRKPTRPAVMSASSRCLHAQILRGRARAGIQFPAGAARGLRGLHPQPAPRRLGVPVQGLRRWRVFRRDDGSAGYGVTRRARASSPAEGGQ